MTTKPTYPDLPVPAGAARVCNWCDPEIAGELYRAFSGSSWVVERDDQLDDAEVHISGVQYPDGRIEREIFVDGGQDGLTAAQARQLGQHLLAAADEAEQMSAHDGLEVTR